MLTVTMQCLRQDGVLFAMYYTCTSIKYIAPSLQPFDLSLMKPLSFFTGTKRDKQGNDYILVCSSLNNGNNYNERLELIRSCRHFKSYGKWNALCVQ